MRKQELKTLIQTEIRKSLKEAHGYISTDRPGIMRGLKVGEMYQVLDSGMNEWNDEYEYLGFDIISQEHMFRVYDSPGNNYIFASVSESDLRTDVKASKFQ